MKKVYGVMAGVMGVALFAVTASALEPTLPRSPRAFSQADSDSNGKISLNELLPKAERHLMRFDTDHNGSVSAAEIDDVLRKAVERRRDMMVKILDADHDGAITEAELDKVLSAMFNSADNDKDGGISLEEARNFKLGPWRKAFVSGTVQN